MVKQHRSHLT